MTIYNSEIANTFNKIADLLEIEGENQYKIRAYRQAARVIENLSPSLDELVKNGEDLTKFYGIGKELAKKIEELVKNNELKFLKNLEKRIPGSLLEILDIPGMGPKKVGILYRRLNITSIEDLKAAVLNGRLKHISGFGPKTEEKILKYIEKFQTEGKRFRFSIAEEIAHNITKYMNDVRWRFEIAGSYRRKKETVKNLNIVIAIEDNNLYEEVINRFVNYEDKKEIIIKNNTKSSIRLRCGMEVHLNVVNSDSFGAAIYYFTGSKEHNMVVKKLAQKNGFKIDEHGVFKENLKVAGKSEKEIFSILNMDYIPPELRENRGEIQNALIGSLPDLITSKDIKGDLHIHSYYTDGKNSIEEIALFAKKLGYEYIAITDHTKMLKMVHGLDERKLIKQMEEIDRLNERLDGITILKGAEVNILEDGSVDISNDVLRHLDITVFSVHSNFNLSYEKQTYRILKAIENPYFYILGHLTGRLIGQREPYNIDIEKIFKQIKEKGGFLELNSQPDRLDINDIHCKMAKEMGIKVVISSDAHHIDNLKFIRFGINQARRGWLEKKDVLNTLSLSELKKTLLKKTKSFSHARGSYMMGH